MKLEARNIIYLFINLFIIYIYIYIFVGEFEITTCEHDVQVVATVHVVFTSTSVYTSSNEPMQEFFRQEGISLVGLH